MTDRPEVMEALTAVNCVSAREKLSRDSHLRLTPRLLRESVRILHGVSENARTTRVENHHFKD
jgi:hypothetical protein